MQHHSRKHEPMKRGVSTQQAVEIEACKLLKATSATTCGALRKIVSNSGLFLLFMLYPPKVGHICKQTVAPEHIAGRLEILE
mmetsp:Transcript_66348/g.138566  ORF Transcript_66348/g.138566 Transcript_66348/m.138566 type:complete len:82 (+) Transcript_66348:1023-1268(+)